MTNSKIQIQADEQIDLTFPKSAYHSIESMKMDSENPLTVLLKAVSQRSLALKQESSSDSESEGQDDMAMDTTRMEVGNKSLLHADCGKLKKDKEKIPASKRPLRKSTLKALRSVIADRNQNLGQANLTKAKRKVSLLSSINQARALLDQNVGLGISCKGAEGPLSMNVQSSTLANQLSLEELNAQVELMLARHSERRRQLKLQEYQIIEENRRIEEAARLTAVAAAIEAAVVREAVVEQLVHARQSAQFQNSVEHMIMRHIARRKMPISGHQLAHF